MNPLTKPRVPSLMELCEKEQIFAPCVWDCRTIHAAEVAGFKAVLLSGGQVAESMCGVPDIGLITADDLVQATERVCQYSKLPVIVDADDGFGDTPLTTYRLIKRLIAAGAKGCTLDDTTGIRGWNRWGAAMMAGYKEGSIDHKSVSRERWLSKVKAALKAAEGTDFLVIARTECKLKLGLEEAILRCRMARELGAKMTLIIGLKTIEEAKTVDAADPGPKMWPDVMSKNGVPDVVLSDVEPYGFCFVTCHYLEKAMMFGAADYSKHVIADRSTVYVDMHDMGGLSLEEQRRWHSMDLDAWLDAEAEFTDLSALQKDFPGQAEKNPLDY